MSKADRKVLEELRQSPIAAVWRAVHAQEKARVAALGAEIGFGNLMHTAQECWRESNAVRGIPAGAEHIVGPCAVMAAPCGCENGRCDWCCGSGWLTHRVKQAKEASGE